MFLLSVSEKKRQEKAKKKAAEKAEKAEKMTTAQKENEAKAQEQHKEEEKEIDPSVSCQGLIHCKFCFRKLTLSLLVQSRHKKVKPVNDTLVHISSY